MVIGLSFGYWPFLTLTYQCLLYYEAVSVTLSIVISFVHHICPANDFLTLSVASVGIYYWSNHLLSYCLMLFLILHTCRSQRLNFVRVCWTHWMSVSRYTNLLVDEPAWSRNRKSIIWCIHQEINHLLNMWCIWVWGDHSVKYCKWLLWTLVSYEDKIICITPLLYRNPEYDQLLVTQEDINST